MKIYLTAFLFVLSAASMFAQRAQQSINTDWLFHKGDINLKRCEPGRRVIVRVPSTLLVIKGMTQGGFIAKV